MFFGIGEERILYGTDTPLYFAPSQRARIDLSNTDPTIEAENRSWYPFQLAFILLNLPGVTTFYMHVEALSVTPFSPGAISRGLAASLVSLVRLRGID